MGREFLRVDPATLRLPSGRVAGADPTKLAAQIRQFADQTTGMPPLLVTRGIDGEMMINDGVTRVFRVAKLLPRATIEVEVIDDRPISFKNLPLVKEHL